MKIKRIINNNIVTSLKNGHEVVVMGRGIGFNQKPGNLISKDTIEKIFELIKDDNAKQFKNLLADVPIEEMQSVEEIISFARLSLGKPLSETIYVALTDHIHFAIQRIKSGMEFNNALEWEVKHFYNHEYLIAKEGLNIIFQHTKVKLPTVEAATIALHLVNAEMGNSMSHTVGMTKIIKQIISIIQYTFHVQILDTSLAYERLLTHLKFFIQRVLAHRTLSEEDPALFKVIKETHLKEYQCSLKIGEYIKKEFNYDLTEAELAYLTIHINRVVNEN